MAKPKSKQRQLKCLYDQLKAVSKQPLIKNAHRTLRARIENRITVIESQK